MPGLGGHPDLLRRAEPAEGDRLSEDAEQNPWYLRPFFGPRPVLPREAERILRLVALGLFLENYDVGLLGAALPQIAGELGISESHSGYLTGWIRLGGLGTLFALPLADRLGRRRVFLTAVLGTSFGCLATALSQTALQFGLAQLITRVFMLAASMLAVVIVIEEFPAAQRGAGIGMLTVLGGLGFGLAAVAYGFVGHLSFGWRILYGVGVVPALLLPAFRRALPETSRFERHRHAEAPRGGLRAWAAPLVALARTHPRRVSAVGLTGFFTAAGGISLFQYASWHVQRAHGWTPSDYSVMVILAGLIGVTGSVVGGRGSDRFGRRWVGSAGYALYPLFAALFFLGPGSLLAIAWGLAVFFAAAGDVILRAMASELFPTGQRGASSGWLIGVQTLGWTVGLFLVGWGTDVGGDLGLAIAVVACFMLLGALSLLVLPETSGHSLESLHGDDA